MKIYNVKEKCVHENKIKIKKMWRRYITAYASTPNTDLWPLSLIPV